MGGRQPCESSLLLLLRPITGPTMQNTNPVTEEKTEGLMGADPGACVSHLLPKLQSAAHTFGLFADAELSVSLIQGSCADSKSRIHFCRQWTRAKEQVPFSACSKQVKLPNRNARPCNKREFSVELAGNAARGARGAALARRLKSLPNANLMELVCHRQR